VGLLFRGGDVRFGVGFTFAFEGFGSDALVLKTVAENVAKVGERLKSEWFGEEICDLIVGVDVFEFDGAR